MRKRMLTQAYLSISATTSRSSSSSRIFSIVVFNVFLLPSDDSALTITILRGIARKQPPPDREQPDLSPLNTTIPSALISNQGHGNLNLKIFRQVVERTEHGNIRIRKLNKFRR